MSQAATIYQFLRSSPNRAAENALMLAMHRAEPPYRTAILETVLDRNDRSSETQLISQYHQFSQEWKELIFERIDALYGALRTAAFAIDTQTRLNVLTIIDETMYYRLTHTVVALLRDRQVEVPRRAGEVLRHLARQLIPEEHTVPVSHDDVEPADPAREQLDRPQFLAALTDAVRSFPIHRRIEPLLAAMYITPATDVSIWHERLAPAELVGKTVRHILLNFDQPDLAPFCVSALKNPYLRGIAARSIAVRGNQDFILAVARAVAAQADDQILQALKLIRHPSWLNPQSLPQGENPADQQAMVNLISHLGATPQQIGPCICALADSADEHVACGVVDALIQLPPDQKADHLIGLLKHKYESVASSALLALLEQKHPQCLTIMAKQLGSPHERVRDLAARYFRDIAFGSYWNRFERLSPYLQKKAGAVIFKIDPGAQHKLRCCAEHDSHENRLRATKIARLTGRVEQSLEFIMPLANDKHHVVRSSAVAALGDVKPSDDDTIYKQLVVSLDDPDPRVQANAIEALDRRGQAEFNTKIAPLMKSDSSRVRANAIKTQLHCRVYSARRAIDAMLTDPRPPHRISARWLLKQAHQENDQKQEPAHVALTV